MVVKEKKQGVLFIILAAFFFALMNLFVRLAGDLPTMEKCFFRNAVAMALSAIMLLRSEEKFIVKSGNMKYILIRSISGGLGMMCNFYAIDRLNIADASMLNKLSPFFAIIFSVFILREIANHVEWGAVVLAFVGALFIVKPSGSMESIPALAGVLGGLGAGLAYVFVRKLGMLGERSTVIVFYFSLFTCCLTLPFLVHNFAAMTGRQLLFLLLAGCAACGGQFSITAAYTRAPAKEISVFDYAQVLFAALLGFFFLEQIPDIWSLVGYVIIIGVAVGKWQYNIRQDHKEKLV